MQTYYAIETEGEHRRCTWEQEAAMDARIAQARPENGGAPWQRLWRIVLARLHARSAPRRSLTSLWQTTAEQIAPHEMPCAKSEARPWTRTALSS
jgi:hypothetical protein